jgi:hypothetical protein
MRCHYVGNPGTPCLIIEQRRKLGIVSPEFRLEKTIGRMLRKKALAKDDY